MKPSTWNQTFFLSREEDFQVVFVPFNCHIATEQTKQKGKDKQRRIKGKKKQRRSVFTMWFVARSIRYMNMMSDMENVPPH